MCASLFRKVLCFHVRTTIVLSCEKHNCASCGSTIVLKNQTKILKKKSKKTINPKNEEKPSWCEKGPTRTRGSIGELCTKKKCQLDASRKGNCRLVAPMSSCHIRCTGQSPSIPWTTRRIVEVTRTLSHWVVHPTVGLVGMSFFSFHFRPKFLWTSGAIVTTEAPAWAEPLALFWAGSLNKNFNPDVTRTRL